MYLLSKIRYCKLQFSPIKYLMLLFILILCFASFNGYSNEIWEINIKGASKIRNNTYNIEVW